ncbi:MAG TPA: MBL fold metallo-hydrolase [Candidatus Binatia bacterium]|jgi:glyoxylase-like metal-dependent hydrolase (beta-lactamase superfamily II)|nr:MBL fold metallo-hydrolase [Candidatus Binatia bacterium]
MSRILHVIACGILAVTILGGFAQAQQQPPFATTEVEGTDNVYIFRYANSQAMFVVTSAGVIATDPIGYGRPQAVTSYVDEIKKVTNQPIRYVIYSHHHFDHIAGGKPFKDAGATFIAHKRAKERLERIKDPHTVLPDETVDNNRTIKLGDTTLELTYLGLNHSDNSLVMFLPKEKIIFAVDFITVGTLPARGMIDSYPLEWEDSLKKVLTMDWERLIPGHPGPGGRLGTKQDAQDILTFLQEASAEVRTAAREGKCYDAVEKEMKLPKYSSWPNYQQALPFTLTRYCGLWGRGT